MRTKLLLTVLLIVLFVAGGFWYSGNGIKLTEKDILLLGDFENSTGDVVFDGSLREALSIGLAQSPVLNLVSAEKVAEALRSQSLAPKTLWTCGRYGVSDRRYRQGRRYLSLATPHVRVRIFQRDFQCQERGARQKRGGSCPR